MAELTSPRILDALVTELQAQGQGGLPSGDPQRLSAYPIKGTIDVVALAEAVESAVGGGILEEEGKRPSELNSANDG
jgi:hypothetical protein